MKVYVYEGNELRKKLHGQRKRMKLHEPTRLEMCAGLLDGDESGQTEQVDWVNFLFYAGPHFLEMFSEKRQSGES
jgi:hypothetical protein